MAKSATLVVERRILPSGFFPRRQSRIRELEEGEVMSGALYPAPEGSKPTDWTDDEEQF